MAFSLRMRKKFQYEFASRPVIKEMSPFSQPLVQQTTTLDGLFRGKSTVRLFLTLEMPQALKRTVIVAISTGDIVVVVGNLY